MTKRLSKKQMRAIHAKNHIGVVVIKNPKQKKVDGFFINRTPMTQKGAFHSAAKKSFEEINKKKYKVGTRRLALAVNKNQLKQIEKGKLPEKDPKAVFLIAEKQRGGEKLIARLGPKGETPEIIIGEKKFLTSQNDFGRK